MANELDLIMRDPNTINDHIKVCFEDVFAEPDGIRSIDCVWKLSFTCFEFWKGCCYKFVTLLCGCFIAWDWGMSFACQAFYHIWFMTPLLRSCSIDCAFCQKVYGVCCNCCFGPICNMFETCLGNSLGKK